MVRVAAPDHSLSRTRERAGVRARALRQSSTDAERSLWQQLRDRRLAGFKFRRQHPVGPYFADFACVEAGLVIELDGGQHLEPDAQAADLIRTQAMNDAGWQVLRFDNRQVLTERLAVLTLIHQWLADHAPHPNPLPQAGEGVESPKD
jgi:very-short-patch-repair endonuclease